jgi:hypothetical protein
MKDLKQIAKELEAVLPSDSNIYTGKNPYWLFYKTFSGYLDNEYFSIFIYQNRKSSGIIEIEFNTENRMLCKKMLKKIEPKCNILNKER